MRLRHALAGARTPAYLLPHRVEARWRHAGGGGSPSAAVHADVARLRRCGTRRDETRSALLIPQAIAGASVTIAVPVLHRQGATTLGASQPRWSPCLAVRTLRHPLGAWRVVGGRNGPKRHADRALSAEGHLPPVGRHPSDDDSRISRPVGPTDRNRRSLNDPRSRPVRRWPRRLRNRGIDGHVDRGRRGLRARAAIMEVG